MVVDKKYQPFVNLCYKFLRNLFRVYTDRDIECEITLEEVREIHDSDQMCVSFFVDVQGNTVFNYDFVCSIETIQCAKAYDETYQYEWQRIHTDEINVLYIVRLLDIGTVTLNEV